MMKIKDIPGFDGKYYVTSDGEIFRRGKRKDSLLQGFRHRSLWMVKLTKDGRSKHFNYARIVYETLVHPLPDGYVIHKINGIISDNRLINLKVLTIQECGVITGPKANSQPVELLDDKGVVVDSWRSARAAGKALHLSYQAVMDICNKKTKRPMMKLRWEK